MVNVRRPEPATSILDASSFSTPKTTPSLQRTPTAVPLFSSACGAAGRRNGGGAAVRRGCPIATARDRHSSVRAALPAGTESRPRGTSSRPSRAPPPGAHLVRVLHLVQLAVGAVRGDRLVVLQSAGAGAGGSERAGRYGRQLSGGGAMRSCGGWCASPAGATYPAAGGRHDWTSVWRGQEATLCGGWVRGALVGGVALTDRHRQLRPWAAHDAVPLHSQLTL
jgi:hypothetical protein